MDFLSDMNNIIGIATVLGTIAAWLALYPIVKPYILKHMGSTAELNEFEIAYLSSLEKDLEAKNQKNRWSDKFYVEVDTELQERKKLYDVPPAFYVVKAINRHLKDQDFNNLSNIEKIDSSRGQTFNSLQTAIKEAQDNAVVVIAPPGNGKTVSLRNLTIKKIKQRLSKKSNLIPIFVNLGYYTGFNPDGSIQDFDVFLEQFFKTTGYYKYLSEHYWETLLRQNRCIFFLDGLDELPRKPGEFGIRSRKIKEFVEAWPKVQFILACRELDYNRELSFQQILIKPFDRKHIWAYLKKYLPKNDLKLIFRQIENSTGINELCSNPFYLNLVSYFSKFNKKIPENKTQLFNFIIEQFVERENYKQANADIKPQDFILAMSHLAYYLAVEKMTTTVNINEYYQAIENFQNKEVSLKVIEFAIKGELLEFNEQSHDVRFIHNRFQEFFSSHYILNNYKQNISIIPQNFFTNIWWKETVLFVAGLEENVDDFIELILSQKDKVGDSPSIFTKLLRLEIISVAFECIFANLNFHNENIYTRIRINLIQEYERGNTLIKAKVLNAFRHDKSPEVLDFIQRAMDDESLWVSERAFFILTDEQFKIQMTPRGIVREFGRFFLEGRLFKIFSPILKSAERSLLVRAFLPLYFLLLIASIISVPIVGYVFYSFFEFVLFKLKIAFTSECLECLLAIAMAVFILVYALTKNNYPFFKRFIYVVPLAYMLRYSVFNAPGYWLYRGVCVAVGILFFSVYRRYLKKPNEDDISPLSITSFYLGYSISIQLFNFKTVLQIIEGFKLPSFEGINRFDVVRSIVDTVQPYILLVGLGIAVISFVIYVYREIRVVKLLNNYTKLLETVLAPKNLKNSRQVTSYLGEMFHNLPASWAKEILLKNVLTELTGHISFSREQKLPFLNSLAQIVSDIPLKDRIYQHIEDEQNNLRRAIPSSTALDFASLEHQGNLSIESSYVQADKSNEVERIEPSSTIEDISEEKLETERRKTYQEYEEKAEAEKQKINQDYEEIIESVAQVARSNTPSDLLEKQLANLAKQPNKQEFVESLRKIAYKGARLEKRLSAFIDNREEKLIIRAILQRIEQMRH
jgi:hypothetical protein